MVVPLATVLGLTARPLVLLWVGPDFERSVNVIYILSIVVALRVGNATSTVILKGSGLHKFLALSNLSMAIGNLVLSVLLVRCLRFDRSRNRNVDTNGCISIVCGVSGGLPAGAIIAVDPVSQSVWPATWPAIIMAGFILLTRRYGDSSLVSTGSAGDARCGNLRSIVFRFAISRNERDWYFNKVKEVFRRRSVPSTSANELSMPS